MPTRLLVFALGVFTGCVGRIDPETMRAELLATDRDFAARSVEAGAAAAFEEFLLTDALQLPDDANPVEGRGAIVGRLRAGGNDWTLSWEPRHAEVSDDGTLGWTWGEWELRGSSPDAGVLRGKYLNVWRRGPDGRWRVVVDMGNGSPPRPSTVN